MTRASRPPISQIATIEEEGISLTAGFIPSLGRSAGLFASMAAPPMGAWAGVVICPSLHAEFTRNYRTEILLARALARQGLASIRPHYRGHGQSRGNATHMTYRSLIDDARAAAEFLRNWSDVREVAFVGCRVGAFPASALAGEESAPVALWEPVLEWSLFIREAKRVIATRDLSASHDPVARDTSGSTQATDGILDLLGYPIHPALMQSFAGRGLGEEFRSGQSPVFLLQVGREPDLRGGYRSFVTELRERGHPVETALVSGDAGWWFRGTRQDRDESERMRAGIITSISDWLVSASAVIQ